MLIFGKFSRLVASFDLIIVGMDNLPTTYLLNKAASRRLITEALISISGVSNRITL